MMPLLLFVFIALPQAPVPDPNQGLVHYERGEFAAAAEVFRAAAAAQPSTAALHYDLALAEWRAGNLAAAEEAIERYAAAPGSRLDLHRGLLGNLRYTEAKALGDAAAEPAAPAVAPNGAAPAAPPDPVALLEQAVQKARTARDEFVRAAASDRAGAEIARNTERSVRLLKDLEKKLEAAKQQREQQQDPGDDAKDSKDEKDQDQKDQKDQKDQQDAKQKDPKDQDQPQDEKASKDQGKEADGSDPKPAPDQAEQRPEPKPGEPASEPKAGDPSAQPPAPQPQPQPGSPETPAGGDERPEPKPAAGAEGADGAAEPRHDAPGEQAQATELSPEQRQRLLELLKNLDGELRRARAQRAGRKPVERDW